MRYWVVSPGVGMKHLESPKNPDGLNLGIYIFVNMYKGHMCSEGPEGSSVMNPSP
jgi:hypothetical protein